jgi:putative ABC transport system substrate-binding protein
MGAQAAEMGIRVFAGAKPGEIPIASPRKYLLWLNLRAAEEIGLKVPDSVLQSAVKVVK